MKTSLLTFIFSLLFLTATLPVQAAVAVPEAALSQKEQRAVNRLERKQKRMEKRLERWKERIQDKLNREDNTGKRTLSLILGSAMLVGGIILGVIAFGGSVGGFFFFLSGLLLVGAVILLLFALLKKDKPTEG
jgi:Flp pilus assembly protein TadB